ncbi:MAG: putative DNA binding domain-containing protein [Flammeovirgaceae bacterium]|nr:putative DNA binding domain-containing protein [Flammeovirgaceae bacterium]
MIDFIKAQFGVEASTLSYEEVVDYFSIVRVEGVSLEFKSFNGEKKLPDKIYQSICAMLNSAGGLIIWGSPKEVNATGTKECRGDLTPVSEKIKRRFDQVNK